MFARYTIISFFSLLKVRKQRHTNTQWLDFGIGDRLESLIFHWRNNGVLSKNALKISGLKCPNASSVIALFSPTHEDWNLRAGERCWPDRDRLFEQIAYQYIKAIFAVCLRCFYFLHIYYSIIKIFWKSINWYVFMFNSEILGSSSMKCICENSFIYWIECLIRK